MIGDLYDNTPVAAYQPENPAVALETKIAKRDYYRGFQILNSAATEMNDYSVIERRNKDQRTFNSFVDESVEDPNEGWKWRGTRSLARNKAIAMHANITAEYMVPRSTAQDESQQIDRDASGVMDDILDWMTRNSNYRSSYLLATMGMLVNPVTYLEADFCEIYQTIKTRLENGSGYTKQEVLDQVLSGFQANVLSTEQILITNAYEQNVQKQRGIIKVRYIEWDEARAKWEKHPNFAYVSPGIKCVFNEDNGLFYEVKDNEHPFMVEEATVKRRRDDTEIVYLNGVYMGNEEVEWNPIRHRDNYDAPRYNVTPFGYERITEHYYFFKSLMFRVGWDDKLMDAAYEVQMNRELLDLETPLAITGTDKIDTSVLFPSAIISSENPNFSAKPILPPNSGNGYRMMQTIEDSINKESIDDTSSGNIPNGGIQRAYTVAAAAQGAKTMLNAVRKNLANAVMAYGELMMDIALTHLTTAQVDEITGDVTYRTFLLEDQMVNGKKVSKKILFDDSLVGKSMTPADQKAYTMKLLTDVGYPDHMQDIYVANPHLWSKRKYLAYMDVDNLAPRNREFEQVLAERLYTLLRQDPLIEPATLIRKLLQSYFRNETDSLMSKNPQQVMGGTPLDNIMNAVRQNGGQGTPQNTLGATGMPQAQKTPNLSALPSGIGGTMIG